jgi:Asp-tRNA(Asn)/Glu-tRNA(Gln) amidotransferase A subunit family amidase
MVLSIHEAATQIRAKKLTPEALLERVLQRIDQLDSQIHAWVLVDRENARQQARQASAELAAGRDRGPLQGIPLGIKDIFDVRDWPTAAGYGPWRQCVARQDATVVERLRNAGAVFVGKTVTTQFASFDPPPTCNPWRRDRTPGGSSSGSAAGLASGMCLGALASQTGGSITRPAAYCGVAGYKSTYNFLSCAGVVPLAPSLDHPGVMAGCARDLAILVEAIAGPDPLDPPTLRNLWPAAFRAARGVDQKPGRLLRLGSIFREKADEETTEALASLCKRFAAAGVDVIDTPLPPRFAETIMRHRALMAVECAAFHEARLQADPDSYGPSIRSLMEEGTRYSAIELARTFQHKRALIAEMELLAADDILLTPGARGAAPGAETTGDPIFNAPWSYLGFPTVCLPYAWTREGLPLSIQLAARREADARLLEVAAWCEKAIGFERREVPVG